MKTVCKTTLFGLVILLTDTKYCFIMWDSNRNTKTTQNQLVLR